MTFMPGRPLYDPTACPANQAKAGLCASVANYGPFFKSLVAAFMILFLAAGWAYGKAAGTIKSQKDLVNMMSEAMKDMGYYLVLMFAAAHFVAMFNWSNLGLVSAVHGADAIQSSGLPLPIVLGLIVLFAYFPLVLVFAQRWTKDFGIGSLTAMMIPYSIWMLITGIILVMLWIVLGWDFGFGAPAQIVIPGTR